MSILTLLTLEEALEMDLHLRRPFNIVSEGSVNTKVEVYGQVSGQGYDYYSAKVITYQMPTKVWHAYKAYKKLVGD